MKKTHKIVLIFILFTFFISISSTSLAAPEDVSPVADFAANITMGNAPLKVLFTDQSTGSPTSWLWYFGDGVDSKHAMNATHTFTTPGIYTVTLTVTNAAGSNSVTKAGYITVINNSATEIPVADFTADVTSGPAPLKVQFTGAVTGNPTDYFWVFEPETSSDWNSHQAVTAGHTFKNPGV
jgi:PKD repeat protein